MTALFRLRGIELRHVLTIYLAQQGPMTVYELIDALEHQNFAVPGRPSKAVSDALRWEIRRGRVLRVRRGLYGSGEMPRSTEYDILKRVIAMREEPAMMAGRDDDKFWDSLG